MTIEDVLGDWTGKRKFPISEETEFDSDSVEFCKIKILADFLNIENCLLNDHCQFGPFG